MPRLVHLITFFYLFFVASLNAELIFPPEVDTPQLKLYYATCANDTEAIEQVMQLDGVDINKCIDLSFNALHYAIYCGNNDAFHKLLELGADVDAFVSQRSSNGASVNALGLAVIIGRDEMFYKLLDLGADPRAINEKTLYKFNAFAYSALYGRETIFRSLVAKGFDPKEQYRRRYGNTTHYSPLSLAALNGHLEIVRYILEDCKVPIQQDSNDYRLNPLHMAVIYGHKEIVAYLLERGARTNYAKYNTLTKAVNISDIDTVKLLLQNGVTDIDALSGESEAANQADRIGNATMLSILETHGMHSNLGKLYSPDNQTDEDSPDSIKSNDQHTLVQELLTGDWLNEKTFTQGETLKIAIVSSHLVQDTEALLTTELSTNTDIEVLERTQLQSVIDELKLDQSGLIDGQRLAQFSQLSGADVLVTLNSLDSVKQPIVSAKIIDAHLGLVLGVRYFDATLEALEASAREMAKFVQTQSSRLTNPEANSLAISLVNIRANLNTPTALQTERVAKQVLELQLAQDDRLVLLQREQIDALTREAGLREDARQDLLASSVFVDGRIDIDEAGEIEKLTIRLQHPNGGDEDNFELIAEGTSLSQLMNQASRKIVQRLTSGKSNEVTNNALKADANRYFKEAKWLREVGLHKQALETIRTAISLGLNTRAGWILYHRIIHDYTEAIRNSDYSESVLRTRIALEKERLYALSQILHLYMSEASDADLTLNWSEKHMELSSYMQFLSTMNHYNDVSLRRSFPEEFRELEELFLTFVTNDVDTLLKSKNTRAFDTITQGSYISWLAHSLTGCMAIRELDFETEVMPVVDWLIQSFTEGCETGALSKFTSYLRFNFDQKNGLVDVRSARILESIQQYGSPMMQWAFCDEWLDERRARLPFDLRLKLETIKTEQWLLMSDIDRGRMLATDKAVSPKSFVYYTGKVSPYTGYISLGDAKYWSVERERILLAYHQGFEKLDAPSAKKFLNPEMLKKAKANYQAYLVKERKTRGEPDYGQKQLDEYDARLARLTRLKATPSEQVKYGALPMLMWHPSLYGYPEFHHNESFKTLPVFWEGKWFMIGARTLNSEGKKLDSTYLQNPDYYLFEIDPATLATTAKKFKSEHLRLRYWNITAVESGLILYDTRYEKRYSHSPVVFLGFNSSKTKAFPNDIPVRSEVFGYGDSVYFLSTPRGDYVKPWMADHPPSIVIMLKLNPATGERTVIYNSRRNPPENILDQPPGRHYFFKFFPEEGYLLAGESSRGMINLNTGVVTKRDDRLYDMRNLKVEPNLTTSPILDGRSYTLNRPKKTDIPQLPVDILQLKSNVGDPDKRALELVMNCQDPDFYLLQKFQYSLPKDGFNFSNVKLRQAKDWMFLSVPLPTSKAFPGRQRVYSFFSHADFVKAMSEADTL